MRKTVLLLIVSVLFFNGCNHKAEVKKLLSQRNTLCYPISTNPLTFDPALAQDNSTLDLMQQVYENLVTLSNTSQIKPKLAESWNIDSNGKYYTFYLKKGVMFHNGKEMTAEDVKWSFERSANPKLASPVASNYMNDIVGFEERIDNKATEVKGIQILGRYKIGIQLKARCSYFLGKLTYPVSAIISKKSNISFDKSITDLKNTIGTGPFTFYSYAPNQAIIFKAFKKYHEGIPKIDWIERPIIRDSVTRLNKYKAGDIDILQVDRRDLGALEKENGLKNQLKFYERPGIWYLNFNQNAFKPFKNLKVRQAFALAVDRKLILNRILRGMHGNVQGILPWCIPGHRPQLKSIDFNPNKARQLLVEAGYNESNPLPPLELCVREDQSDAKIVAEAIVTQLRKNLKLPIRLRILYHQDFFDRLNRKSLSFYCSNWIADYLDPQNFLSFLFGSHSLENKVGYRNLEFDALCYQADLEFNGQKRINLFHKAEDILIKDVAFIPLYSLREAILIKPKVKNLSMSPFGFLSHSKTKLTN